MTQSRFFGHNLTASIWHDGSKDPDGDELSSYTEHWMIFAGVVFVLIVIFLPGGLVGTARRWIEARG